MRHRLLLLLLGLAAGPHVTSLGAATDGPGQPFRFVVLGHIRGGEGGGLNPRLAELLEAVRRLAPECVVLTGDIIWGEYHTWPPDSVRVEHEWNEVDSALATLGVPVFRVPGNHDLHDPVTREIWSRRYGQLPRAIVVHGHRFLMLRSAAIRPDSGADKFIRGRDLDSTQLEFIRRETANRIAGGRTFAFVHHLLWWQPPEGGWWRQVHPLLVAGGVEAVFSGDFGPVKFSTLSRDGIRYFQTSVTDSIPVVMQRNQESNRMLAGQFDNFLLVSVGEGAVDVEVRTVGWEASGDFSPLRWREVHAPRQEPPPPPRWRRMWELIGSPRRLGAIAVVAGLVFAAGAAFGRARSRRSP